MSVETVQAHDTLSPEEDLRPGTDEALRKACSAAFYGVETPEDVLREQAMFQQVAEVFREDLTDLQSDEIAALTHQREILLAELMKNPSESFHGEFLQLIVLYEDRTIVEEYVDGQVVAQFCTQNHEKGVCDYLFECRMMPSGKEIFEATKAFTLFGALDKIHLRLEDNTLHVEVEKRGQNGFVEQVELNEDMSKRVLEQFFFDTIQASALQFERDPDELYENNQRAKGYVKKLHIDRYAGR